MTATTPTPTGTVAAILSAGFEYGDNMEMNGLVIYLAPDEVTSPPRYDNYNPVN
ncbi:hypothetical protein [Dactylosporangium sp. CA-092794]|uniref:hypothetical protein n=1 Tax=Dactylosporangium sp. CA-092794 TaxID=3239929 RepID=UPI003D92B21F